MRILPVLLASFCLLAPVVQAAAPAKKIKVFIFAGQSNMDGRADFDKISDEDKARLAAIQPRVQLAYNRQPIVPLTGAKGSEGLKKRFGADHSFGPEIFFGIRLAEASPDDQFLFIKRSVGATSLYGRWNPDWDAAKAKLMEEETAAPLYPDLIAYVREVLAAYPKDSYEICGMLWVQGEADSNVSGRGPEPAKAYGQNVKNLIARVRADLGVPALPFMMFQVVVGGDVVRGMQEAAATMKNVSSIPRSMDPASPNFLEQYAVGHYNQVGMKRMGVLFAETWFRDYAKIPLQPKVVAPQRPPDRVVAYKSTPQGALKMHFYFPPGWSVADQRPAMVFWCGGGFRSGGAVQFLSQAEYFSSRGLVAIHTEYRGTKSEGVPVRDCQEDARSAMRWVKAHATDYGIDPGKVIAAGGSAGGSLAMLTAWPEGPDAPGDDLRISPRPAALVLFNPAMGDAVLREIGYGGSDQAAFNAQILALDQLSPDQPPGILLYGERDRDYLASALEFRRRAQSSGLRCEVWVADKASHGFFNTPPWHDEAMRRGDEFLASLGYLKGAPTIAENPAALMKLAATL